MENQKATLEPWLKEFDEKFDGLWLFLATEYKSFDAGKAPKESIKSFIENLLEQEKKRMSEEIKESCSCSSHVDGCSGETYIDIVLSIINKK